MLKTTFTLISRKELTHDVYELIYDCPELVKEPINPWQYVMFQLAPGLNRAYSVSAFTEDSFVLIIKRIPDGRWSPLICDAEIGSSLSGLIPLGHFILHYTPRSKCFISTGTGFAPVFCQMQACQDILGYSSMVSFIFWVREEEDTFYEQEIQEVGRWFQNFEYIQYISRPKNPESHQWYVTDWITPENIWNYEEYYLCGSPAMVASAREKLGELGIAKESIFWEQY